MPSLNNGEGMAGVTFLRPVTECVDRGHRQQRLDLVFCSA